MSKKKELSEEEKIDSQILDLLMKKRNKNSPRHIKCIESNVWKSSTKING